MITKLILISYVFFAFALSGSRGHAQSQTFLSNLGETTSGYVSVGSNSLISIPFLTGNDVRGYFLDSVQLSLNTPSGNPNTIFVSIHRGSRSEGPGILRGFLSGSNPSSAGVFSFAATNMSLSPLSIYWLQVSSDTPVAMGSFSCNLTSSSNFESNEGWALGIKYDLSTDGINWNVAANTPLKFAINASVVPEPSSLVLLGLGGSFLFTRLARKSRSRALSEP